MRNVLAAAVIGMVMLVPARAPSGPTAYSATTRFCNATRRSRSGASADPDEEVTVLFRGVAVGTNAGKDGKWAIKLPPQKAGGPDELTIRGKNTVVLKNVLVGEVWICSGQSNMEWSLRQVAGRDRPIPAAADEQLRLFRIRKVATPKPRATVPVAVPWQVCNPESAENFSAVGYYFGRDLRAALGVPVGLIQTAWGGTPAQAWTSREALSTARHCVTTSSGCSGRRSGGSRARLMTNMKRHWPPTVPRPTRRRQKRSRSRPRRMNRRTRAAHPARPPRCSTA